MPRTASSPLRPVTPVPLTEAPLASLNLFLPSLLDIAATYGAPYALVALPIGGHLAVTAALQLVFGRPSDRCGWRRVLLASLVVFALSSAG